jgi:hypothetical protein
MESTKGDSITKSLLNFFVEGIGVIMIRCYFIQLAKMMSKGKKRFIYTHKTVIVISVRFKHLNLCIKGGIVHSILPFSFHYCYVVQICINFLVKMKGSINKEMVERMKRKESLDSKLGGSQLALRIN